MSLIRSLPDTALDILGDIHGEFSALMSLLKYLGYDQDGRYPNQSRHLVFVGDFVDRGMNSPAVCAWLQQGVEAGYIYAVLGNHDINLLMGDVKEGSGWYFDERYERDLANHQNYQRATPEQKQSIKTFLNTLPVVLEREDMRIIHAAWLTERITEIRDIKLPICEAYTYFEKLSQDIMPSLDWYADYQRDLVLNQKEVGNKNFAMPLLTGIRAYDLHQNGFNPLRAVTCGTEIGVEKPFFAAGRWRFTTRYPWWRGYSEKTPVVFGHYWRMWKTNSQAVNHLFPESPQEWLQPSQNTFCVDYSVGKRWEMRRDGLTDTKKFRLAALRWPERELCFDDGECVTTHSFNELVA